MKRLIILLILTFTVLTTYFVQKIKPGVDEIVKGIVKDNILKSAHVGISGIRTEQWERYLSLKEWANDEELIALTDNENGVIRCYSFQALAARKNIYILPILIKHLTDTATVKTFQDCIISSQMVGDYFLDVVSSQYLDVDAYQLTNVEKQKIDSILIFDKKIKLVAKSEVVRKLKPEQKYYDRLREMVIDNKDNNALITLSKYQKQQDRDFIVERFRSNNTDIQYSGLQAVKYFPDSSFFPILSNIHSVELKKLTGFDWSIIRTLYQAIVQYKNSQSRKLLELTLNTATESTLEYHSRFIWLALELYPDKIYDGIQKRIQLPDFERRDLQYWIENKDR